MGRTSALRCRQNTYMRVSQLFQIRDQLKGSALQRVAVKFVAEQGDGVTPHVRSYRFAEAGVTSVGGRFGGEGVDGAMGVSSSSLVSLTQAQIGSGLSGAQPVGLVEGLVVVAYVFFVVVVVTGERLVGEIEGDALAGGFGDGSSVASENRGSMLVQTERDRGKNE